MKSQGNAKDYKVIKTIIATMVLLVFYFVQGAVVIINELEGTKSVLIQGMIIWTSVIVAVVFSLIKNRNLTSIGFCKPEKNSSKESLYYIPMLVVALLAWILGIDFDKGRGFLLAYLFFTLSVGFAEEIYFRGIICNMWKEESEKKAIIVSSVLFGICHLMNVLGGASLIQTSLQICFAFAYGVAVALIFIISKSIWPCILLHAFHDFCSFISCEGTTQINVILGAIQFIIIIVYIAVMIRKKKTITSRL
jgi:membrane protease YdiL (CAAX protease family)